AVKAISDGVSVIGISRGQISKLQHTERLERGEVMVAEFTEAISAVKIRGHCRVFTPYGEFETEG
ncbi:MAG: trp RNA-binding attenuation protein MtrB, partial [Clostridia bacterium]|nr:trp RNA-binding attenuation protein MtrB [Clostridia bacterium]